MNEQNKRLRMNFQIFLLSRNLSLTPYIYTMRPVKFKFLKTKRCKFEKSSILRIDGYIG